MGQSSDTNNKPERVDQDVVVSLDYTLNVDGEIVDFSDKEEPLQYIQGRGQIIPGLEREMAGMTVGQSKEVRVAPKEGYGMRDPEAVIEISRAEFPPEFEVIPGAEVQVRNIDGEILEARIDSVEGDKVRLDFNHPLAGKELLFTVTVVDLRMASPEELMHGHVHGEGGEDEYEEDYDGEDYDEDDLDFDEEEDEDDL